MKTERSMQKSKTLNMTEGRPLALLAVFSLPLLIGNLFQQAYNLADSIIVGKLIGAAALASIGATGSVTFLFFSVCNGIGDSLFALTNGVVEMIYRIGLPMILILIPVLGVWGIWWCAGLSWMISSFFCVLRYRSWNRKSALTAPARQAAAS